MMILLKFRKLDRFNKNKLFFFTTSHDLIPFISIDIDRE